MTVGDGGKFIFKVTGTHQVNTIRSRFDRLSSVAAPAG
jgi:hypothetical protein